MRKVCPRCGSIFECCSDGDISRCHCTTVALTDEQRANLKAQYSDCLCNECLRHFAGE
ncbi:MAG: cysteine-rich CWC family protein [Alistipes sp.]|nr:cysteine-rich CWC family protein [Alistipes sp.]